MKVLNLQCRHGHVFEGWFSSEDDYRDQQERGLVSCPLCSDTEVSKLPTAPRLNLRAGKGGEKAGDDSRHVATGPSAAEMQALWLRALRHVVENTEDVGERFVEEARRIHYGEAEARNIRGQATREETEALLEEGIEVMPLPLPPALKEPTH
ncbi:DUF1178 family protein [Caldimonas thermodepolymerans]|jgi:Uncharacterized protein conserved in bacteria|uniref:DUF1178 domain-containing protein n=1 Tax=Caldimonas thermodepolymerans TaxID=215580 RepID=A0A2S5T194_9BURK|nr:DUF1178 family protein [Caldimonas thermodepolymerans]PPE68740.1 DUF1178 domain-containing protein [Caldimonas thermodepolymerans]QPC30358.1 DUF1178 family protein [Caldimonas thermodepolymerans]RDH95618.1 hypothetical protein DES46_11327 [Caldimonas thermodepolymerans]TCP03685.1 hypothetical protein EV676_11246 [Caldimonas thermodepolymerans]UZG43122.1 DUF1178 family protein [Caldimonas thermodepolymerans]